MSMGNCSLCLKTLLIQEVNPFIVNETGRRPLILPIFMDIKK